MIKSLVKTINIGDGVDEQKEEDDQMKDIIYASMTFDDKKILTIEKENDHEAYIRAYILDEDAAELEEHD